MPKGYLYDVGGEEPPEERKPRILEAIEKLRRHTPPGTPF
jgi:hypothetical protein